MQQQPFTTPRYLPATGFVLRVLAEYEHVVLGAMLLLLHLGTSWEFASALSRSLMLAHLGLFLIWQPIWRGDQRLDVTGAIVFLVFTAGFIALLNAWLLACWFILIIGLVGGRTLTSRSERLVYMLSLLFLISKLLIVVVPLLFPARDLPEMVSLLFRYGLLVLPCLIATLPARMGTPRSRYAVDLFRGMTAALMAALVALGSVVTMYRFNTDYTNALMGTSLALAGFLFAISWLLTPGSNAGGLAELWERSLLNIGTPFEEWLTELAELAEEQQTPAQFLTVAMQALVRLPWAQGVEWTADEDRGAEGQRAAHFMDLKAAGIDLRLYLQRRPSPTLLLHGRLLLQLLGHFYTAKHREQELARQTHMQAIYETGARVTHDIKNLLQSLQTMTLMLNQEQSASALPHGERRRSARTQRFVEKQMPLVTQRLQLALDKLQSPAKAQSEQSPLRDWWQALIARRHEAGVSFEAHIERNTLIPGDLFDSVIENLLENTRYKRQLRSEIEVRVTLFSDDTELHVRVTDSGDRVPDEAAAGVLKRPVPSNSGLGVGLYQSARQADSLGYVLTLLNNEDGRVVFELRRRPDLSTTDQYSLFLHEIGESPDAR